MRARNAERLTDPLRAQNVDAASGCVLYEYGMSEFKYYTVIFGISRAIGALPQLVMDR